MYKKISCTAVSLLLILSVFSTASIAKTYEVKTYEFTWEAAKEGDVTMQLRKTQSELVVILTSPGWKLASVTLTPSQTKAIGEVLTKVEEYHDKHKNSDERENFDTVPAADVWVIFTSKRKGRNFEVRVQKSKHATSAVLMPKEVAVEMGKHMRDAENMAAYIDKAINP